LLEACCLAYGLYFVASRKGNGGSGDVESMLALLEGANVFTHDRGFNAEIVAYLVWGLTYCRLALLDHLLTQKKISTPREWLHIQLSPTSYFENVDYFALNYTKAASVKGVKNKCRELFKKHGVHFFIDEAQVLLFKMPDGFKSTSKLKGRSLLSAFCRPLTTENQKVGLAGTTLGFEAVVQELVSQGLKEGVTPKFNEFVPYTAEDAWDYAQRYLVEVGKETFIKKIYPWLFGRHRFLARYCAEYLVCKDVTLAFDRIFSLTQPKSKSIDDSLFKIFSKLGLHEAEVLVSHAMDYLVYGGKPREIDFPDYTVEDSLREIEVVAKRMKLESDEEGKEETESTTTPLVWTAENSKAQQLSTLIRTGFFRLDPKGTGFWFDEPLILLTFVNRLLLTPQPVDLLELLLDKMEESVSSQQGVVFEQITALALMKGFGANPKLLLKQIQLIEAANIHKILGGIKEPKKAQETEPHNAPTTAEELKPPTDDSWFYIPLGADSALAVPKVPAFRIFGYQTTADFLTQPSSIFNHPPDLEGPDQQFWLQVREKDGKVRLVLVQIGAKFRKEVEETHQFLVAKVRPEYLHIYKNDKEKTIYRDPKWKDVCQKVANFFQANKIPVVSVIFGYPKNFKPNDGMKSAALWIGKHEAKDYLSKKILDRLDRLKHK